MSDENPSIPFSANQAWVTYIYPFVVVRPKNDPDYSVSLEEINNISYNHGKLCQVVTSFPISVRQPNADQILVCFDGALALPRTAQFVSKDRAVEKLNNILCSIL